MLSVISGDALGDLATSSLMVLIVGAVTYLIVSFGMEFIRRRNRKG